MAVELRIRWDGQVRDLAEHRLSVDGFAIPLHNLLAAMRRRASSIITQGPKQGSAASVGRLAAPAAKIDIEIRELLASSIGISGFVVMNQPQVGEQTSFPCTEFLEHTTELTLDAIDEERRGIPSDQSVRKYLDSLPKSITGQEYTLTSNGQVKRTLSFGQFKLSQRVDELPSLREIVGKVIGVGFDPGTDLVRVKGNNMEVIMESESALVEQALKLRGENVRASYVGLGRKKRLLQIDNSNRPRPRLDVDEFIFEKWSSVIEALAK